MISDSFLAGWNRHRLIVTLNNMYRYHYRFPKIVYLLESFDQFFLRESYSSADPGRGPLLASQNFYTKNYLWVPVLIYPLVVP